MGVSMCFISRARRRIFSHAFLRTFPLTFPRTHGQLPVSGIGGKTTARLKIALRKSLQGLQHRLWRLCKAGLQHVHQLRHQH